jgi:hypothetical protein
MFSKVNILKRHFDNSNEAVNSQCCQSNLKIIAYSNYKFKCSVGSLYLWEIENRFSSSTICIAQNTDATY